MKKTAVIIALSILLALLCVSCSQDDIVNGVVFHVTLDQSNTYVAGAPVKFNFSGDADFIVFYSGETNHEYRYSNRNSCPVEDVQSLTLNMQYLASWGTEGGMDIFISTTFPGLDGQDGEKDRQTIRDMVDGGMQGWTKMPYIEGASEIWTSQQYDLTPYLENFSIAFHWHPWTNGFSRSQRTYNMIGKFTHKIDGVGDVQTDLKALSFVSVVMNEQEIDPYMHDHRGDTTSIATVRFEDTRYDLYF